MTVTETDINMFKLPPDTALVCPVNCRGVMGKGLAKEFRNRYPEINAQYKRLCQEGKVHPGEPFVLHTFEDDRTVVMFPTKDDWRDPSKAEWITAGLQALPDLCREKKISSIAIPPVGAGLGGLDPAWVKGQVQAMLGSSPDLNVTYTSFAPKVSQSNIEVCNLHDKNQQPTHPWDVRLDRGHSVLANPDPMNGDERLRDKVCNSYRNHFEDAMQGRGSAQQAAAMQQEVQRLKDIYNKYGKLRLFCWCAPARCHCETVRNFLEKDMDLPVTELTPPKQTLDLWTKDRVMQHVDNSNGAYPDMPKEFWFEGDLSLLDTPCVAMVGNRDLDIDDELAVQARSAAELLAGGGVTVLSGLAEGSDSISMKAAHEAGGKVIAFSPYPVRSKTLGKDRLLAERILEDGGLVVKFSLEQDKSFGQMAAQRDRYMAEKAQSVLGVTGSRPLEAGPRFAASRARELSKPLYILDDKRNFIAQRMFEAQPLERDEYNSLDASIGAICDDAKEVVQAALSQPRSKPLISDTKLADANEIMDEPIPVRKVQYKPPRTVIPRNVTMNFDKLDISPALKNRFIQDGYRYMSKAQAKAIADILSGNNVLAALPTSAGKSLIGEIAMLSDVDPFGEKWVSTKGEGSPLRPKAMYIVPTKALATEKVEELIHLCGEKKRVAMASSDSDDIISSDVDLLVATAEKADSMLRHQDRWLCGLTTVVADEIHTIADPDRGAIYEATIISFKHMPGVRVVGLSGTVPNDKQMSAWLSAERTTDDARRSKLRVAVYDEASNSLVYDTPDDSLVGKDKNILRLEGKGLASSMQQTVMLTKRAVSSGKQVIVFVLSRKSADNVAKTLREAGIKAEAHHAGLTKEERHAVEQTYKAGKIGCIVSTPTLAMGVNMPAETVIIKDLAMFDPQLKTMVPLPKSMVHQMAGRAGRGNKDGEAYLLPYEGGGVKGEEKGLELNAADIERMYMYSASENVQSYLFGRADDTLERAVLGMYGQGQDPYVLMDSFSRYTSAVTDEARQREIELATNSLIERGMLAYDGGKITLTEFGRVTANLCIRPTTAVALRDMCMNLPQWMEVYAGPAEQTGPYDTTPLDRRLMGVIAQCAELKGTAGGDREQKTNWARLLRSFNMDIYEYYGQEDRQRTAYLLAGAMYRDKDGFLDGMMTLCGVYAPDFTDKVEKAKWLAHAAVLIADVVNPKVTGYLLNIEPRLHDASAWLTGATYDEDINLYRDNLAKRGFILNNVLNPSKWDKVDGKNDGALTGEYVPDFSWYIPSGVDTPPAPWPPEAVGIGGWDRITDDYVRRKCDTAPAGDRTHLNTKVPRYIQSVISGVTLNNGDELEREVYQSIADWYNSLDPVYKNVMGKTPQEQNRLNYMIGDKVIPKATYQALADGFTRALMYTTMRKNTGKKKDSFFGDVDGNAKELNAMLSTPEQSVQEAHKEYDESQKAAQDREADVQAHYKKRNGFIARKRRDYGLEYVPQTESNLITPQDKPAEPARIFLTPARGEYLNTDVLVDTLTVDDDQSSTAGVIDHEASGHKFRFGLNTKSLDAATAGKRRYTSSVISAYLGQTRGNRLTFGTTVWNTLATGAIVVTALRKKDMSPADWMVFRRSIVDGIKSLPAKYGVQSIALPRGSNPNDFKNALNGYDLYIWDPEGKLAGKGYPVVDHVDNDRLSPIDHNADRRENSFKSQIYNLAGSTDPLIKALSKYGDSISSMDEVNPKENLLKALNGLNPAGSKRIALTGLNQLTQDDPRIPEVVNFINQSVGSTIICTVPPEGCTPIEEALAAHGNVVLMVGNWPDLRGHRALIDTLLDHNWENPAGSANAVISMPVSNYTDVSKKGGKEVRTRLDEVPVALATDVAVAACNEPYSAAYHSLYMDSGKNVTVLPGNKGLFRRVSGTVEAPAPLAPEALSPGALVTLTLENLGKSPEKIASFAEFCGHDPALAMNQVMALPGAQDAYAKAVQRLTQLNSRGAHVLTVFDKGFDRRWSHNEVDPRVHLTYMGNLSLLNGVRAAADGSDHLFDTEEDERSIREENHAYSRALGSYMQALTTPISQNGAYKGVIATGTHSSGAAAAREAIYRTRGKQIRYLDVPIEDLMDLAGPDSALMWLVKNARFKDPTVQAEFDAQGKKAEDLTAADQKRLYSLSLAGDDGELDPAKIFGVDIETGNTQTDGTAEYTSVGGRSAQAFRLLCYSLDKKRQALMDEAKAKKAYTKEKRPEVPRYMEFEFNGTNKIMLPVHPTYTYTDLLTDSIALHQATDDGDTLLLAPTTYSSDANQWTPADSLEDTMVAASDQMIMAGSNKKRHLEWNAKGPMLLIPVSQNNRVEGGADMSTLMYGGKDFYLFKENEYDEEEIQNERGAIKIKKRGADSGVLSDWANAAYYGNTTMDALFPDLDDQC